MTDSLNDSEFDGGFIVGEPQPLGGARVRRFELKSREEIEGPADYTVTVYISKGDESVADFTRHGVYKSEVQKVLSGLLHTYI